MRSVISYLKPGFRTIARIVPIDPKTFGTIETTRASHWFQFPERIIIKMRAVVNKITGPDDEYNEFWENMMHTRIDFDYPDRRGGTK